MEYLFALIQFLIVAPMFLFPGCNCCGGDPVSNCGVCTDDAPYEWRITLSGITDGMALDCDPFNGTFDVPYISTIGTLCVWNLIIGDKEISVGIDDFAGSLLVYVNLVETGGGLTVYADYSATDACDSAYTLDIDIGSDNLDCNNLPATVTITPV
jgi:hypothetical protein